VLGVIEVAKTSFSDIHILVNSAGITDRATLFDTSEDFYNRMFAINVKAPFFLMQGVSRLMVEKNISGSILNILSMSSYGGQPFLAAYSASKAALLTLTKNSAFALMRNHIRVNGINLGWTNTPGEDYVQRKYHNANQNWLSEAETKQPFGRLIKIADVAELAYFILSEKSGVLTGAIIDYDQSVHGANYLPPRP
jgi:NAD(P)-dependent dehydrogenase (short-subunit alcohol dehydrogenase family)